MRAADRPVIIAGGGIAGLAAAIALAQRGIASHVIEQRSEFPQGGAGIQIGPNGTKILRALGVAGTLEAHVAAPHALVVHDAVRDRILKTLPLGSWIAERHGAPYWTMHRRDLHAALLTAARDRPSIKLETGCEALRCESLVDGVRVLARDTPEINGRALIVADGLWSRLRRTIGDTGTLRAVGKAAYRSVVARGSLPASLDQNAVHLWLAPGCHAVHYPVSGGAEIALVVIRDDTESHQSWSERATESEAVSALPAKSRALRELFHAADAWRKWSLYARAPSSRFHSGRVVAIGDAAHPVLPFLAQGGVLAIEDAVMLAKLLSAGDTDFESAFERFSRARRKRAAQVASAAAANGRVYHMAGIAALARNATLAAAPAHRIMHRYDWLYGWEAPSGVNYREDRDQR